MTKLAILVSTGNPIQDKVLAGAFGTINPAGQFEVANELKGIHLFTLLKPELLGTLGIDMSSGICSVEVADEDLAGVKATMLYALQKSWDANYVAVAGNLEGIAAAAFQAERASVNQAVTAALEKIALPSAVFLLERDVKNLFVYPADNDEYDDEADDSSSSSDDVKVTANEIGSRVLGAWAIAPYVTDMDGLPTEATSNQPGLNYFSAKLVSSLVVYGRAQASVDVLAQLPPAFLHKFELEKNARFATASFHQEPVTIEAPAAQGEGSEEPAPSA